MLRAGLIAAEIKNTTRQKNSDRIWRAWDFVGKKEDTITSASAFQAGMKAFADAHNRKIKQQAEN